MTERALDLREVSASYGAVQVLHGVSLHVLAGQTVALIGSNGAGKTSLVRALNGLLPLRGGELLLQGEPLHGLPAFERTRRGLATVAEGRLLFPELSVQDNLLAAATHAPARAERDARLAQCYTMLPRLRERHRQAAGSLSGGEQQMVAIARALMTGPRVLVLDEPSTGLSPRIVQEVFETLAALRAQGFAILLVEQNVALSLRVAQQAYVLAQGRIVLSGSAAELTDHPGVRSAYLGA